MQSAQAETISVPQNRLLDTVTSANRWDSAVTCQIMSRCDEDAKNSASLSSASWSPGGAHPAHMSGALVPTTRPCYA